MAVRRTLGAVFRQSRTRPPPAADDVAGGSGAPDDAAPSYAAELQIMAHTLIADLYGAGLRVQNLVSHAPVELHKDLEEVAGQIDKVIGDVRAFAFTHRG
jgi:hypothetical protein